MTRALCDAGRCEALLRAFAEHRVTARDRDGAALVAAVVAVLREYGLDPDDETVRQSVARHLSSATGTP